MIKFVKLYSSIRHIFGDDVTHMYLSLFIQISEKYTYPVGEENGKRHGARANVRTRFRITDLHDRLVRHAGVVRVHRDVPGGSDASCG